MPAELDPSRAGSEGSNGQEQKREPLILKLRRVVNKGGPSAPPDRHADDERQAPPPPPPPPPQLPPLPSSKKKEDAQLQPAYGPDKKRRADEGGSTSPGLCLSPQGTIKTSRYRGVSRRSHHLYLGPPWMASMSINGRNVNLGYYATEEEAARVYDRYARKYHKKHPILNFDDYDNEEEEGNDNMREETASKESKMKSEGEEKATSKPQALLPSPPALLVPPPPRSSAHGEHYPRAPRRSSPRLLAPIKMEVKEEEEEETEAADVPGGLAPPRHTSGAKGRLKRRTACIDQPPGGSGGGGGVKKAAKLHHHHHTKHMAATPHQHARRRKPPPFDQTRWLKAQYQRWDTFHEEYFRILQTNDLGHLQWVSDQLSMGTGLHDDEGHDQQEGQSGDSQSSMAIEPEVSPRSVIMTTNREEGLISEAMCHHKPGFNSHIQLRSMAGQDPRDFDDLEVAISSLSERLHNLQGVVGAQVERLVRCTKLEMMMESTRETLAWTDEQTLHMYRHITTMGRRGGKE